MKSSIENLYSLDGRVPVGKALPFGLQHILAMFVSNITPIMILSSAIGLDTKLYDYSRYRHIGTAISNMAHRLTLAYCNGNIIHLPLTIHKHCQRIWHGHADRSRHYWRFDRRSARTLCQILGKTYSTCCSCNGSNSYRLFASSYWRQLFCWRSRSTRLR